MKLVVLGALLLAGCTTNTHDAPRQQSEASGAKRWPAGASRHHLSGKARPRRGALPSAASRSLSRPAIAQHLNWPALAHCESTGNPRAVDPSGMYFGLYQFDLSTWASVGGAGNPVAASPTEQTYRAELLYARAGDAPWPVCGWRLAS
jgi:hypothetical protein